MSQQCQGRTGYVNLGLVKVGSLQYLDLGAHELGEEKVTLLFIHLCIKGIKPIYPSLSIYIYTYHSIKGMRSKYV